MNQSITFSALRSLLLISCFGFPLLASAQICGVREGFYCCQDLTPEVVVEKAVQYCINKLDGAKSDLTRTPQFFKVTKAKTTTGSSVGEFLRLATRRGEKLVTKLEFKEMTADEMLKAGLLEVKGSARIPDGGIGAPVLGEVKPSGPQVTSAAPVVQVSTEINYVCNLQLISMCRREIAKDLAACEVGDPAKIICLKPSETFECKVTTKNCSPSKMTNQVGSCAHLPGHEEVKNSRTGEVIACLKKAATPTNGGSGVVPGMEEPVPVKPAGPVAPAK